MSTLDGTSQSSQSLPTRAGSIPGVPDRTLLVGCGRIGTLLGERLVAAGGEVVALRRTISDLPAAFAALSADLREPVECQFPEVDAVVITLTPSLSQPPAHPEGYLTALKNLAAVLPGIPPRVVFVSSTRVFEGRTDGQVLTEHDAPAPVTPRGKTLRDGELLAARLFNAHIVRPAGIYGPGREMIVRKVLEQAPVQYVKRTNRIHEVDLVRTLESLLTAADPPRLVHAVDQRPALLGEVVTFIADRLGLQPPPALQPEETSGTVLDGGLLHNWLGPLRFPTFQAGYENLLAYRTGEVPAQD